MPKFEVIVRRDAWINYLATIEAETPEAAVEAALKAWKTGDTNVKFDEIGMDQFDHVECTTDDVEEL